MNKKILSYIIGIVVILYSAVTSFEERISCPLGSDICTLERRTLFFKVPTYNEKFRRSDLVDVGSEYTGHNRHHLLLKTNDKVYNIYSIRGRIKDKKWDDIYLEIKNGNEFIRDWRVPQGGG